MHYQCLIIDDEQPLAESTAEYFNLSGVSAAAVFTAPDGLAFLKEHTAELILLDINLGDSSGFELCRRLREETQIPILFISARQSDDDILLALNIGGDDYIRKPYALSVLLAKVRAVLRRYSTGRAEMSGMGKSGEEEEDVCRIGRLEADLAAGCIRLGGEPVKLKAQEYKLLAYLIRNRGRVLSKEELFREVWEDAFTGDGTLNVHIRHLREKLEEDPNEPRLIRTVWGTGYVFGP